MAYSYKQDTGLSAVITILPSEVSYGKETRMDEDGRATESGSESNLLLLLRWWRLYRPARSLLARKRPNFLPCPAGLVLPLLR